MRNIYKIIGLMAFCFLTLSAFAQDKQEFFNGKFENGTRLFQLSRWNEAAAEFRSAQEAALNRNDFSEALYWVIMSELSGADYGSALRDMDALEKTETARSLDIIYHRARSYYYLGYFEESLIQFKRYIDKIQSEDNESRQKKAAAYFWMGECLYAMGQIEEAEKFYTWVMINYPSSPKIEISSYRIDLIKQKKIESELLMLLKWSHEENLRTNEDYERKIKTYEHTLNAYQRRVTELSQDSRMTELELSNADYQRQLAEAQDKIILLEDDLSDQEKYLLDKANREKARKLREEALSIIGTIEIEEGGRQ
jgi:tetratricopeptide (TPR) repeat protein